LGKIASLKLKRDAEPALHILDPRDPMGTARALLIDRFVPGRHRSLQHHQGAFWQWNGACYRPALHDTIRAETWRFLDTAHRGDRDGNPQPFRPNRARVSDVMDALAAVCNVDGHVSPPTWLVTEDGQPAAAEILPVPNRLLHLPSGHLYPASPLFFGLNASRTEYNPATATPGRWLTFLAEIFGGDDEAAETLQDWCGYCLAPDTSQQKIFLQVGPPRSGKGTIARVITELVGKDNVAAPTLASLSSNFGLAPLIGKPLAIISDARLGSRSDQAAIAERLLSISGEDAITIDRKFQPAWTGRLPTRFMVQTNELPRLHDTSGALPKRFVVVALNRSFLGKEDPALTIKLLAELPGILNWAREGYLRLRSRGYFVQPESAKEAIEELETLGSPVAAFVKDRCVLNPACETGAARLYEEWCKWCSASGRNAPGNLQSFGRDLKAAFPGLTTSQSRALNRARVYHGIRVL
jgi:putative DNA primase/helicase